MLQTRIQAFLFAIVIAIIFVTCIATPRFSRAQGVTFANSHWGTAGAGPDFSGRVVRPVMLDTILPPDLTGWSTTTVGCDYAAFESAILAAAPQTIVEVVAPNCTMNVTQDSGVVTQIAQSKQELVVRGDADGNTVIRVSVSSGAQPPIGGHETSVYRVGTTPTPASIQSWTWDSGFAKGSQILGSSQAISELYDGDIIYTEITGWSDGTDDYRAGYRVLCARWSNANVEGTDCTGITANNQIKIDRELPFQMDGLAPTNFFVSTPLAGKTISHISRRGECADTPSCGTVVTSELPYRIGFERLTIEHADPNILKDFVGMFEVLSCFECWLSDVHAKAWGNSALFARGGVDRLMILSSRFTGPYWAQRCNFTVNSITLGNPATADLDLTGCRTPCAGTLEPLIYFPETFAEAELQGVLASCTCVDCTADSSVDVTLFDSGTGANINVTSSTTPAAPNDWAIQTKNYGIASVYFVDSVSQSQIIDTIFDDTRVGFIQQQGAGETVLMGNYCTFSDGAQQVSRCFFIHGGHGAGSVWERNDSMGDFTVTASATQWEGSGPFFTYIYNRGRQYAHTYTHQVSPQCPGGGLCNEGSGHEGKAVDNHTYLGNFFEDITGATLDLCVNDAGGNDCSNPGPQVPFFAWYLGWSGNVVYGETIGSDDFETGPNPTSQLDDYLEGDAIDTAPAGWASYAWPTSLAYDRQVVADSAFSPAWWCNESGPFHEGMGAPVDDLNGGSPSYSKLPAQIRYEAGTCTPLAGSPPVTPSIRGGSMIGGGINIQ